MSSRVDSAVTFREMTAQDIPAGLALCRASGWNQVERDWRRFLETQPGGALVAERDSRVIGTVATMRYGRRFAWVAMVLVDPAERSRGVGRALLTRGLSLLDDVETVRLDATPAGEPLYKTLGFVEEARFSRLQLVPGAARMAIAPDPVSAKLVTVRPLAPADWDAVAAFDARVFGADRRAMLEWLWAGAPQYAWVARDGEQLVGYVLGRSGHLFEHLGPVIADDAGHRGAAAHRVSAVSRRSRLRRRRAARSGGVASIPRGDRLRRAAPVLPHVARPSRAARTLRSTCSRPSAPNSARPTLIHSRRPASSIVDTIKDILD